MVVAPVATETGAPPAERVYRHVAGAAAPPSGVEIFQADAGDSRLQDFVNLRQRAKTARRADASSLVAEGAETIRQLFASGYEVGKVLLQPALLEELRPALEARRHLGPQSVFVAEAGLIEEVTGLCVINKADLAFATVRLQAPKSLGHALPAAHDPAADLRVLALDGLTDADNVGKLLRIAAAFGVGAVLCSSGCCDPFTPKAVRASGGYVFRVPVLRGDLVHMLGQLRSSGTLTAAAVVQDGARFLDELGSGPGRLPRRWALVVGSEHFGVSQAVRQACEMLLKVRMAPGVDSLNVVVSAGVLLHGCAEREAVASGQAEAADGLLRDEEKMAGAEGGLHSSGSLRQEPPESRHVAE